MVREEEKLPKVMGHGEQNRIGLCVGSEKEMGNFWFNSLNNQ